jgi:hypothetical protein
MKMLWAGEDLACATTIYKYVSDGTIIKHNYDLYTKVDNKSSIKSKTLLRVTHTCFEAPYNTVPCSLLLLLLFQF